jgi:heptosyltransferase-2
VLIVRLDGLGDCVLTLPLLEHLRLCFPSAVLTVVTRETTASVFRASPDVDEVLTFEPLPSGKRAKLLYTLLAAIRFFKRSLSGRFFDIALMPRWDIDVCLATFLCALTRAPVMVGYEDATTPDKLRHNPGFERTFTTVLPAGPTRHEVLRNLELAAAVGCLLPPSAPRLTVDDAALGEARAWMPPREAGLRIALGVPAGSPKRRWPAEKYLAVLEALQQCTSTIPIILADGETKDVGEAILARFPSGRIASSFALPQLTGILAACDLFLGSDSGLAHIAAAVGLPTYMVSPHPLNGDPNHTNSPYRFHPYCNDFLVFQPPVGRAGCERGCEAGTPHCILDIDELHVSLAIAQARGLQGEFAQPVQDHPSRSIGVDHSP